MPIKALSLRVSTPTGDLPHGRGFYQLEEEVLYFPIEYGIKKPKFYSYLESSSVSLQLDKKGKLIFIELTLPRRRWKYKKNLIIPERAEMADIRFLDFRETYQLPDIYCDKTRENLMIRFGPGPAVNNYFLAENLIGQTNSNDKLIALWLTGLIDDIAGQEISNWCRELREGAKRKSRSAI